MAVALLFRKELPYRGEDHAAGGDLQFLAQVGAIRRLHGWLAQEVAAAGEGAEDLVVEIVAVGQSVELLICPFSGSVAAGRGAR